MLALIGAVYLLAATNPANAQDACATFKWPIEIERGWFADGTPLQVAAGGSVPEIPDRAIRVTLAPANQTALIVEPRRKPAADSSSGVFAIAGIPAAGTYQVTLSQDAWIEVVQDGAALPAAEFSGVKGCAGVRKSVRFDLKGGPAHVQITGAPASQILIAIRRVP
ncbi:MAG: hypothetical protein EKK41_13945 [Hyphomicrobiales bacterium]|nr:MAG: hypothetical protein EKK41_13945 [Hyphomicrobiales bacterium]